MFRTAAFDHRLQRAVVQAADFLVVADVVVALQDGQHLAGVFEDLANCGAVLDTERRLGTSRRWWTKHDALVRRLSQVCLQPLQFGWRDLASAHSKFFRPYGALRS